jgi:hypothetical protein
VSEVQEPAVGSTVTVEGGETVITMETEPNKADGAGGGEGAGRPAAAALTFDPQAVARRLWNEVVDVALVVDVTFEDFWKALASHAFTARPFVGFLEEGEFEGFMRSTLTALNARELTSRAARLEKRAKILSEAAWLHAVDRFGLHLDKASLEIDVRNARVFEVRNVGETGERIGRILEMLAAAPGGARR